MAERRKRSWTILSVAMAVVDGPPPASAPPGTLANWTTRSAWPKIDLVSVAIQFIGSALIFVDADR